MMTSRSIDSSAESAVGAVPQARRADSAAAAGARVLVWKIWLPVCVLLLVLDVTFNLYFWRIPKLTGAYVDYPYQFLLDVHHQLRPKPDGEVRVLAFGSSIAGSFDADQVRSLIESATPLPDLRLQRILLPGIKPSDWRVFFEGEEPRLKPDVVVILLNLVDFLNPSFERDLKPEVRYVLPPWRALIERHAHISDDLDFVLAGVSNLYRYRKLIRSALQDHVKLALRWLRAPSADHGYGFYVDGYTRERFGLPIAGKQAVTLEYYVNPEWIRQQGQVTLSFSTDGHVLADRTETEPGWKTVHLNVAPAHGRLLEVAADSAWNPRAGGLNTDARLLGVELRQPPPPAALNGQVPPLRYPPIVPTHELLRMGDAVGEEYVKRFDEELADGSAWAKRFLGYKRAKLSVCNRAFKPTGEYHDLERLVAAFARDGVKVVMVNNPESPLLLRQYEDTPYYRAHVQFLRSLADKYRDVRFYELDHALPPEDFNDWHHVNYIGSIKLGPFYADFVRQALADKSVVCAEGSSSKCSSTR
jgi:hypothetical protein